VEATLSTIDKSFADQVKSQIISFGEQIHSLVKAAVADSAENVGTLYACNYLISSFQINQSDLTKKIDECMKEAKRNRLADDSTDANMTEPAAFNGVREEDFMSD